MTDLRSAPVPAVRPTDHVRGPAGAPTVVVYADFTCPRCALAQERLATAEVRVVFRHLALQSRHPRAVALARAVEAAGAQDAFWVFHDALYADQGRQDDPHLWEHARTLGLDLDRFEVDRRAEWTAERVKADVHDAVRAGVTATPTLFAKDAVLAGPPDAAWLAALRLG
jgi:protein-disulfide isomerase